MSKFRCVIGIIKITQAPKNRPDELRVPGHVSLSRRKINFFFFTNVFCYVVMSAPGFSGESFNSPPNHRIYSMQFSQSAQIWKSQHRGRVVTLDGRVLCVPNSDADGSHDTQWAFQKHETALFSKNMRVIIYNMAVFSFYMCWILLWNVEVTHQLQHRSVWPSNKNADFTLNLKLWWATCSRNALC